MIRYVTGDATYPIGIGPKVLCHVCNDRGGWGKGFVLAVSQRWEGPEQAYRRSNATGGSATVLGRVQLVEVEPHLYVANMIAQHGYKPTRAASVPLRYDALRNCLHVVHQHAEQLGASIHMPRIGTGLAGGDWSIVEPIIQKELDGLDVTVYDLPKGKTQ